MLFQKTKQYRYVSFHGPEKRKVCLNYVLIRRKWTRYIRNIQISHPLAIASDHNLITVNIKWSLRNNKRIERKQYRNYAALRNNDSNSPRSIFVNKVL